MPPNSITLDFKTMPTVTVDGKTHTFKKGEKEGEFKPIDENVGGVTYSLVKDKESGRYKMTITGDPKDLAKYNFGVSKGRVTDANFGGGDSMENFFKGDSHVGDKKKAPKYFQSFSIGGAHLENRTAFLQSGAWGLDKSSAKKELERLEEERLEEEAKKAKEAEGSKKNSGTQEAGEQMVKTEVPNPAIKDPVDSAQKPNEAAQDNLGKEKDAKIQEKPADIKNPPNVDDSQNQVGVVVNKTKEPVTKNVVPEDPSVTATSKQPMQATEEQLEANLKALESNNTKKIKSPGIGLPNGANNCFENVALAAFRGMDVEPTGKDVPRLQNYVKGKVTTEGQALALREEVAKKLTDFPDDIKQTIKNGSFQDQHDAAAVFQALLNASNCPKLKIKESYFYNDSQGVDASHSKTEEQETCLSLPVVSNDSSMQKLADRFFGLEALSDYKPEGSDKAQETTKTVTLAEAPEKMAVQIKRFASDNFGRVSRMPNSFSDVLDGVKITTEDGGRHKYQPTGIIVHKPGAEDPTNANSGHYIYYENMDGGNTWREINDDIVTYFNIEKDSDRKNAIKQNCYLVTYQKVTVGEDGQPEKQKVKLPALP